MKVKLAKRHRLNGKLYGEGTTLDLPPTSAELLIRKGRAHKPVTLTQGPRPPQPDPEHEE